MQSFRHNLSRKKRMHCHRRRTLRKYTRSSGNIYIFMSCLPSPIYMASNIPLALLTPIKALLCVLICVCVCRNAIYTFILFFPQRHTHIYILGDNESYDFPDARKDLLWHRIVSCSVEFLLEFIPTAPWVCHQIVTQHSHSETVTEGGNLEVICHQSWCCFLAVRDHVDMKPERFSMVLMHVFMEIWLFLCELPKFWDHNENKNLGVSQ